MKSFSARIIADNLGTSREAVIGKLNRLGLIGSMREAEKSRRLSIGQKASHASGTRKPKSRHRAPRLSEILAAYA